MTLEARDTYLTYKYGSCEGCINFDNPKEQLLLEDAKSRTVTIELYADIEFREDIKLKYSLKFVPDDLKNNWLVSGSPDISIDLPETEYISTNYVILAKNVKF